MRSPLLLCALYFMLQGCASLPQAPVGSVTPKASLALREYKIRKHHIEVGEQVLGSGYVTVSGEMLDLKELEAYLRAQGSIMEADKIAAARSHIRLGIIVTVVSTAALAPIGVGLFLPYFIYPAFVASSYEKQVRPAAVLYNASLSRRWLSPALPPEPPKVLPPDLPPGPSL